MKKQFSVLIAISIFILCISSAKMVLQNNGIAGFTGSPGEQTCTNCHNSFAINSGGGSISISISPSITANEYMPGATYTIEVTAAKTGVALFGFGTEILNGSNANAGTISVLNSAQTKLLNSGGKTNIVHQLNGGAGTDMKTFSFKWIAPLTSGSATIYAAGIAANGNNSSSSDYVYKTSLALSSTVGIKELEADIVFTIFPNPTSETINLSYFLAKESDVRCELTSLTGKVIETYFNEKLTAGEQKHLLNLPQTLAAGVYLLNIKSNTKNSSRRIIIN